MKMNKLRAKGLFMSNCCRNASKSDTSVIAGALAGRNVIEWEVRPGGMLVQKRHTGGDDDKEAIRVRVSTGSKWHDISIGAGSTFGKWISVSFQYERCRSFI